MPKIVKVESTITEGRFKGGKVIAVQEYGLTPKGLTIQQILADVHTTITKLAEKPFYLEYPHYKLTYEIITY